MLSGTISSVRNISDQDEELEVPKAADSHLTPSIFDNEHVKWVKKIISLSSHKFNPHFIPLWMLPSR